MKKFAVMFLILAFVLAFAGCSHEHIPGPAATCTTAQVCTECGEADPNYTEPTLPPVDGEPTPAPSFFEIIMNAIIMFFLQIMALLGL